MNRVIVAGGGASGLVAAIIAAKEGAEVMILEGAKTIGRKIAASGNGRCNLSNTNMDEGLYSDPVLARAVLNRFGHEDTLKFFSEAGLLIYADSEGRVYPYSNSSASVVGLLTRLCSDLDITIKTETKVQSITADKNISVMTDKGEFECGAFVYAVGSGAGLKKPFDNSSLLAGHAAFREFMPALVPLVTDSGLLHGLDGVRARAYVTLLSHGQAVYSEAGEVQFRADALSGIAIFNASVHYVRRRESCKRFDIQLDLMPDYSDYQINELAKKRTLTGFLYGAFSDKLAANILARNIKEASEVKRLRYPIYDTYKMSEAQIASGGISGQSLYGHTLQSRVVRGLFFCGEAVDIDAPCGGYNLQWAWSSGAVAGKCAAEHVMIR